MHNERRREVVYGERLTLADLALCHSAIATDLAELARTIDTLPNDQRRARLLAVSVELGDLGDQEHATRIALRALAEETFLSDAERELITATKSVKESAITADDFPAQRLPKWKQLLKRLLKL